MKKEKNLDHLITNRWKDLSDTAKSLGVPVSVVLQAREILKTNQRDKVIEHIKTWTPVTTSDGHPIGIPDNKITSGPVDTNKLVATYKGRPDVTVKKIGDKYVAAYDPYAKEGVDNLRDYDLVMGTVVLDKLSKNLKNPDIEAAYYKNRVDGGYIKTELINADEIRRNFIDRNVTKELINDPRPFKDLVFTITEADQSWWSRLFRSPKTYRVHVTGEGVVTNPNYNGLMGMQCYNESIIDLLSITRTVK